MDFFMKIFSRGHKKNMAPSNAEENCNITGKTSLEQCHPEVDNLNYLETESTRETKDNESTKDSSVISIHEFGFTKTFHNLETVVPIEINTNDNIDKEPILNEVTLNEDAVCENAGSLNFAAEVSSVITDDRDYAITSQSDNDLKQTQVSNDTSNTEADTNNVIDDKTMQHLKEFEQVFINIDKTALYDDLDSDLINLDDIFDEMDDENVPLNLLKSFSVTENNDSATLTKMTGDKEHSNIDKNLDIISINSSNEDVESQTVQLKDTTTINSSSDELDTEDGYNSSDFEFISETEAKMTGIIINFEVDKYRNLSQASSEPIIEQFNEDEGFNEMPGPSAGPSRKNKPKNEFEDRSYRNDHRIPEGDDFLSLFQGIYNPHLPMSEIYFLENKSVRTSAMNSQYDGMGFDKQLALRRYQPDSSEDEFDEDARESAKKILDMFPGENRKRRRRYYRNY